MFTSMQQGRTNPAVITAYLQPCDHLVTTKNRLGGVSLDNLLARLSQPCHNPCSNLATNLATIARLLQGCYKLATMLSIHGIKIAVLPCDKVVTTYMGITSKVAISILRQSNSWHKLSNAAVAHSEVLVPSFRRYLLSVTSHLHKWQLTESCHGAAVAITDINTEVVMYGCTYLLNTFIIYETPLSYVSVDHEVQCIMCYN